MMSLLFFSRTMLNCLVLLACGLAGCSSGKPAGGGGAAPAGKGPAAIAAPTSPASDAAAAHDPDDVMHTEKDIEIPKDYAAFVARLEQLSADIREKITAGMPTKAHRSLDELDIILKKASEIASKSVAKDHWKTVNVESKELAAAHDELHEKIDAKQNPDYAAVAARIQKSLEALKAVPTE